MIFGTGIPFKDVKERLPTQWEGVPYSRDPDSPLLHLYMDRTLVSSDVKAGIQRVILV